MHSPGALRGAVPLPLSLAVLPGCREAPSRDTGDDPVRTVLPGGDPGLGRVTFYMQRHFGGAPTDRELLDIGRYQAAILRELLRDAPEFVFQEGQSEVLDGPKLSARTQPICELFPGLPQADFSDEQLRSLAHDGASLVYAALRPGVAILPTAGPEFEARIHREIDAAIDPEEKRRLTMDVREVECVRSINVQMRRLGSHAFAVIYGREHLALPQRLLSSGDAPPIEVADWPALGGAPKTRGREKSLPFRILPWK